MFKPNISSDDRSPVEIIVSAMQSVLEIETVEANSNFFEIGGDSLAAARVISRVQRHFDTKLPLSALLRHPTATALGAHLILLAHKSDTSER